MNGLLISLQTRTWEATTSSKPKARSPSRNGRRTASRLWSKSAFPRRDHHQPRSSRCAVARREESDDALGFPTASFGGLRVPPVEGNLCAPVRTEVPGVALLAAPAATGRDDLQPMITAPFPTGDKALCCVAFYGSADGLFRGGWPGRPPGACARSLRRVPLPTNGLRLAHGSGSLGALMHFSVPSRVEDAMRDLVLTPPPRARRSSRPSPI